jgi:hypothetical protein
MMNNGKAERTGKTKSRERYKYCIALKQTGQTGFFGKDAIVTGLTARWA